MRCWYAFISECLQPRIGSLPLKRLTARLFLRLGDLGLSRSQFFFHLRQPGSIRTPDAVAKKEPYDQSRSRDGNPVRVFHPHTSLGCLSCNKLPYFYRKYTFSSMKFLKPVTCVKRFSRYLAGFSTGQI